MGQGFLVLSGPVACATGLQYWPFALLTPNQMPKAFQDSQQTKVGSLKATLLTLSDVRRGEAVERFKYHIAILIELGLLAERCKIAALS